MSSYVDKVLITGEKILYRGRISHWSLWHYYVVGTLLLALYGVGLFVFLLAYIKLSSTELAITNKRLIAKFGFISRATVEIGLHKVESLQVHQTVLGRLFDFGSVTIAGAGTPQAPIASISDPLAFRRAFTEAQELSRHSSTRYPPDPNNALMPERS